MKQPRSTSGFSFVEIMIVVSVIAILAILSMPALERARQSTLVAAFANDIRQFTSAVDAYSVHQGKYPPDALPGEADEKLKEYLPLNFMESQTPIGGQWDLDMDGIARKKAAVGVGNLTNPDMELIVRIDFAIDDGNIVTGNFRWLPDGGGRPYWIIEE